MAKIFMHFEVAEEVGKEQTEQLAKRIEERLGQMEAVEEVSAEPEGPQRLTGLEVVAAIGVVVMIARSSRELLEELHKWIPTVKNLVQDFKELKDVFFEVGKERVSVKQLTEEHLEQLAE
jgi:uncharacterized protein (DUF342 family)